MYGGIKTPEMGGRRKEYSWIIGGRLQEAYGAGVGSLEGANLRGGKPPGANLRRVELLFAQLLHATSGGRTYSEANLREATSPGRTSPGHNPRTEQTVAGRTCRW